MKLDAGLKWAIAIFTAVFAWNLLTSGREVAWGDARSMWEVAAKVADSEGIAIKTRWPVDIPAGEDGKTYGIAPIGPSLVHVPGAYLAGTVQRHEPKLGPLVRPLAVHLAPAALGALACVIFFGLLVDLGARRRTASLCTAILALATATWVYARYPYSEILQLTAFLGLFRQVLRVAEQPVRREALWLGAWAGVLLNAKYVFALPIATGFLLIAWLLRKRRAELLRVAGWTAVTGVPFVILALWYNYARWGSIAKTGYEPYLGAYFGGSIFDGAWGMLLSPNKSAFLYSPPLVLAALGMPHAIRKQPRLGYALAAMVVPTFLVYCTYRSWSGDWAWGPRFFVWCVPVLCVGLWGFFDQALTRWRIALAGVVVATGIVVQLLGNAVFWDHFIRIASAAKNQWLGNPNRSGAYVAEAGRGHCDSCFEDTYELLWTPAFQPIRGHWWLVKAIYFDETAAEAQAHAPWRTYTSLDVNLTGAWWPRFDWWGFLWIKDVKALWKVGLLLLLLFTAATAAGIWMWIRLHRRATDP
jgi:hypothetical protein